MSQSGHGLTDSGQALIFNDFLVKHGVLDGDGGMVGECRECCHVPVIEDTGLPPVIDINDTDGMIFTVKGHAQH